MERVRDYSVFAIGYCGFGYLLLWPFMSPHDSGQPFGAAFVCGDSAAVPLRWLCALSHPLHVPISLHLLGLVSAALAAARLALLALARLRAWRAASTGGNGARAADAPATNIEPGRLRGPRPLRPIRPLRPVKPRTHFGLRGTPH